MGRGGKVVGSATARLCLPYTPRRALQSTAQVHQDLLHLHKGHWSVRATSSSVTVHLQEQGYKALSLQCTVALRLVVCA